MGSIDRQAAAQAIDAFLRAIGRDPSVEPELRGSGPRVADAFVDDLCSGYAVDTRALVAGAAIDAASPSIVVIRDMPLITTCPHHLMPAMGTADVALEAKQKIIGIGAIAELVDAHARRLTLQEHIGERVIADLGDVLAPSWVACRIVLVHACMARGGRTTGARVETLALRGGDISVIQAVLGPARGGASTRAGEGP